MMKKQPGTTRFNLTRKTSQAAYISTAYKSVKYLENKSGYLLKQRNSYCWDKVSEEKAVALKSFPFVGDGGISWPLHTQENRTILMRTSEQGFNQCTCGRCVSSQERIETWNHSSLQHVLTHGFRNIIIIILRTIDSSVFFFLLRDWFALFGGLSASFPNRAGQSIHAWKWRHLWPVVLLSIFSD